MNRMLRSKCGDRKRELCQSDNVVASAGREINFNPDLYQMFQDISAKSPERIEGFRAKIHADIEAEKSRLQDPDKMHIFMDLLLDACYKIALTRKEKGSAAG